MKRTLYSLALLFLVLLLAGPAPAQTPTPLASVPSADAAKIPFQAGVAAFQSGRYEAAIADFREAIRLRDAETIGDDVMRRIQQDLDFEEMFISDETTEADNMAVEDDAESNVS